MKQEDKSPEYLLVEKFEKEIQEVLSRFASDRAELDEEPDVMVVDFAVAFTALRIEDDQAITQYLMGPTTTAPHACGLFDLGRAQIKNDFFASPDDE